MGYRKVPTIYTLKLEKYPGLEVRMKGLKVGEMRKLVRVLDNDDETTAALDAMFALVGKGLVSWNLEDEQGKPVPATMEEIEELEYPVINAILNVWLETVTGVDDELGKDSSSGEKFPGLPVTMEAL